MSFPIPAQRLAMAPPRNGGRGAGVLRQQTVRIALLVPSKSEIRILRKKKKMNSSSYFVFWERGAKNLLQHFQQELDCAPFSIWPP